MINGKYEVRISKSVDKCFGVELTWRRDKKGYEKLIRLSQVKYSKSFLSIFSMGHCKMAPIPMLKEFFSGLCDEENKNCVFSERYQKIIGSIFYISIRKRPDIIATEPSLALFEKHPTMYFHRSSKRVMRYLKGTIDYRLKYKKGRTTLGAFLD